NATAGIKIQNRTNTSQSWQDVFYVDTNGVLTAKGINVVGGTINGTTGTFNGTVEIVVGNVKTRVSETIYNEKTDLGFVNSVTIQDGQVFLESNYQTSSTKNLNITVDQIIYYDSNGHQIYVTLSDRMNIQGNVDIVGDLSTTGKVIANGFVYSDAYDANPNSGSTHVYIRPKSGGEVRATVTGSTSTYAPIRAKEYNPPNSLREMKKNIEEFTDDVLDTLMNIKTYTFNYNFEEDGAKKTLGLMLDEAPEIIWNASGDSIDMYSSIGYLFTGLKQAVSVLDNHESLFTDFKTRIEALEQKLGA
uniref:tail fiber domain-containing protein n=1 Tax=Caenibacillus caldisaponilyticus TaxID=1674942 RepID=UPI001178B7F2